MVLLILLLVQLIHNVMLGSMYDDIRLRISRSYTSFADNHLSLISSVTLSNHLFLGLPSLLYFHFNRPPSYVVLIPSHHMHTYNFNLLFHAHKLTAHNRNFARIVFLNHDDSSFICR